MDQRKLIKLGNSSFAIALPKQWVSKAGLKKGDNIFITPNSNGELIVQSKYHGDKNDKKIIINLKNKSEEEIKREISSAYVRGNNFFEITEIDGKKKAFVEHLLKSLISLEIIEKNKTSIVAKDFFDLNEINLENFLRRIDNSLRNMFEEVELVLKNGSLSDKKLKEIYEIDWDINRLYFLIYRVFIKSLGNPTLLSTLKIDCLNVLDSWQIAVNIGKVGDEIKRICKLLNHDKDLKGKGKVLSLFLDVKKIYLETVLSYYDKDLELAKKVSLYRTDQLKKCAELAKGKNILLIQIAEKFEIIFSSIHEISKLIIYTINQDGIK